VEEWFQVGAFEKVIDRADWDSLASRVERNVQAILAMFDAAGVKATFFTLGWVAQRHPALIRAIADAGHEVASHGWDHQRVFTLDPATFAADLARARDALEQASGQAVTGYRAPSFSIDARNPWAHEVLAQAGYAYSSSVAPIVHDHYGWREAPRFAFRPLEHSTLLEIPVTTAELAGRRMAAGAAAFSACCPMGFRPGRSARSMPPGARRRSISTRGKSIPTSRARIARRGARAFATIPTCRSWRPSWSACCAILPGAGWTRLPRGKRPAWPGIPRRRSCRRHERAVSPGAAAGARSRAGGHGGLCPLPGRAAAGRGVS
jgi:polysaccharide deacetylase family protein (PEP-CTERM system associated)